MSFWIWLKGLCCPKPRPLPELSDEQLLDAYFKAGKEFAEAHLDLDIEEREDFRELLNRWVENEGEMVRRGFVIFRLETFVRISIHHGLDLDGLGERFPEGVTPILHARAYREEYDEPRTLYDD